MPFSPDRKCLLTIAFLLAAGVASGQEPAEADAEAEPPAAADAGEVAAGEVAAEANQWATAIDAGFREYVVTPMETVLFYDLGPHLRTGGVAVPAVVLWLAAAAVFLTLRMGFINLRAFRHAIAVTKGDYDEEGDEGEVSHFQALSSALSATVGLGNIGGVAVAVGLGGPGAVFWMVMCGLLGMTSKFTECTLGQMYRRIDHAGHVSGGPMRYLADGFTDIGLGFIGKPMAGLFAALCILASFGGGCAFQVSQSRLPVTEIIADASGVESSVIDEYAWVYGAAMAVLVGIVIIGGIRRIAATAEKIVPLMCLVYVCTAIAILAMNLSQIGPAIQAIFSQAFTGDAAYGGVIGAIMVGMQRGVFSNEAGVGSAAIAHSAAKTKYPVREGIVALLEPFIDTVVVCTMTGLVIIVTGVCTDPANAEIVASKEGATLTSFAFKSAVSWFPFILAAAVVLFAYSTMISWSYYGERCATYLFGLGAALPYRLIFVAIVFLSSVIQAKTALDFSDLALFSMSVPNLIGLYVLSGKVKLALDDYWVAYKLGDFKSERA
ncbi:MAG: alanine/glycine:cation symporter family protein [Planctomycetota bacterium]